MKNDLFVIKYRWPILIGCILVTAFFCIQLRKITIDPDFLNLLPPTMTSRINTSKIEKIFGSNDMLFVLFETNDVLNEKTLRRVESVVREFHEIKGVEDILSLFDTKRIVGENGSMIVEPAVKSMPASSEEREILRKQLSENELATEIVVSKDYHLTAVIVTLTADAQKRDVYLAADSIIKAIPGEEKVHLGGAPAFQYRIVKDIVKDISILIPAALLVILLILYGFFRQLRGVLLPFGVVFVSMIFGVGILPLLGWKITAVSVILPIMVVAFSNNYGLYLIAKYNELCRLPQRGSPSEIVAEVLRNLSHPIIFTGITTMVGILGLVFHILVPAKQIGIAAAAAIGFSIIASLGAIPAILSLLPLPKIKQPVTRRQSRQLLETGLTKVSDLVVHRPKIILAVTAIIILLAIVGALQLKVDTNQENLFAKNHPVRQSSALVNKHFGGSQSVSVLVEGDIKDPQLLGMLEKHKDTLQRIDGVGQVTSMADVLRIMSKAINDKGDQNYDRIPETRDAVAQYLELYSMSGDPGDFEKLVDFNYEKAQFVVRLKSGETPVVNNIVNKIKEIGEKDKSFTAVGGFATVFSELANTMINGQIQSILFALVAIALLVMLLFRSLIAGLLCSIPLVVSILLGFGVMGAFGLKLDIATAMIMSIVIGTGVDFAIQFLWRFRNAIKTSTNYKDAMLETMTTTGKTITFNVFAITAGFSTLFLATLPPLKVFAMLFCILTLTCMFATLFVVPALCVVLKPRFLYLVNSNNNK